MALISRSPAIFTGTVSASSLFWSSSNGGVNMTTGTTLTIPGRSQFKTSRNLTVKAVFHEPPPQVFPTGQSSNPPPTLPDLINAKFGEIVDDRETREKFRKLKRMIKISKAKTIAEVDREVLYLYALELKRIEQRLAAALDSIGMWSPNFVKEKARYLAERMYTWEFEKGAYELIHDVDVRIDSVIRTTPELSCKMLALGKEMTEARRARDVSAYPRLAKIEREIMAGVKKILRTPEFEEKYRKGHFKRMASYNVYKDSPRLIG